VRFFNAIIPGIVARASPAAVASEAFGDQLREECRERYEDANALDALRRRLDLSNRYWGKFRGLQELTPAAALTMQNGLNTVGHLLLEATKRLEAAEQRLARPSPLCWEERSQYLQTQIAALRGIHAASAEFHRDLERQAAALTLGEEELERAREQLRKRRVKEANKKKRKRMEGRAAELSSEAPPEAPLLTSPPTYAQSPDQASQQQVVKKRQTQQGEKGARRGKSEASTDDEAEVSALATLAAGLEAVAGQALPGSLPLH
jgi:hypothetical protein